MESVDFASLLADLESMPHTNVNARPIGKAGSRKPNDFSVRVTLQLQPRKQKRFAVTKGSARLQMLPPSLMPPPRATCSDAVSDTTEKAIIDHAHEFCPTSPHQRDVMKRRTGPCTYEEKAALILSATCWTMQVRTRGQDSDTRLQEPAGWGVHSAGGGV